MGKPINPNISALLARNEERRQQCRYRIVEALSSAGSDGLVFGDLARHTNSAHATVRAQLIAMRERDEIHIGRYVLLVRQLVPCYVLGPGEDALIEDYRHLQDVDVEGEARKEVWRKHAKWARTWLPHRPAEAAWF